MPVIVTSLFGIGPVRCRPKPKVVIKPPRRPSNFPGKRIQSAVFGDFDFYGMHFSYSAVAHKLAGTRIEPAESVPIAKSTKPHATADAEPLDEPPGILAGALGLTGVP